MLRELFIENFVLIDRVSLHLCPGFTVITGDTGAGKSLLVKAFKLLLGARGETRLVGEGGKNATIQAVFDVNGPVQDFLDQRGIDHDGELIVRRIIAKDGKGQIYINSVRCTLGDLKSLSNHLISIAGQHEFQKLLDKDIHLRWLDEFGDISVSQLSSRLSEVKGLQKRLSLLVERRSRLKERREELLEEAKVIDEINPTLHEEDELSEELKVLRQTEKMRSLGQELYQLLYGDRHSVVEGLDEAKRLMDKMVSIDVKLQELGSRMESLALEADDIAASIRDYLFDLPVDDSRLRVVEERLFQLRSLRKRFGPSIEDVIAYRRSIEEELSQMEDIDQEIEDLEKELKEKQGELIKEATLVSEKRKEAATRFQALVEKELRELNLPKASFQVEVKTPERLEVEYIGARGMDSVTFVFSANPGQAPQPLSQVASGGELSRILLAIKVVMGGLAGSETLIFDEIDSGLGGEVAEKVGKKLKAIANKAQVIAITHFPQIASLAHCHIVVEKEQSESHTVSKMYPVEGQKRVIEIARMLGGDGAKAKEYAKELLGPVFRGA